MFPRGVITWRSNDCSARARASLAWVPSTCLTASTAKAGLSFFFLDSAFSSLLMASFKSFEMSNMPTTPPDGSTTGRCRKRWVIIRVSASMAESLSNTHCGLGVIISVTLVKAVSRPLATARMQVSVSVRIPERRPFPSITMAASPRLLASIWVTDKIVSCLSEM